MTFLKGDIRPGAALRVVQKRYIYTLNITIIAINSLLTILLLVVGLVLPEFILDTRLLVVGLVMIILASLNLYLVQNTKQEYVNWVMIITLTFLAIPAAIQATDYYPAFLILGLLAIVTASTLGNRLTFLVITAVILIAWLFTLTQFQNEVVSPILQQLIIVTGIGQIFIGALVRMFVHVTSHSAAITQRTTDLLEASASLGQTMSRVLDPKELIQRAVELIQDRFAFYHVQVFLLDGDRQYAELVASTGEIGQQLLERNHRLAVGSESVIGQVTISGQPIIASDTDQAGMHAFNELLPNTRSELAIPIIDGEIIIGALDVQSLRANAFNQTDIQALRVMASQLATAIRNAELFELQNTSLKENQKLYQESEQILQEIRRLNQQLTQQAWEDYLAEQDRITSVQVSEGSLRTHTEWTDTMRQAYEQRGSVIQTENNKKTIAIPVELRGEIIGVMEVVATDDSHRDVNQIVATVSEQLAVRLDNARLIEELRDATIREQTLNEMVSRYQATNNVDELLQLTLTELSRVLGAESAMIRIGTPMSSNGHHSHNGTNGQNGGSA